MAYKRRTYRKRTHPTKGSTLMKYASGAVKALAIAKSAYNTAKFLKGLINTEKKKYDRSVGATELTMTGAGTSNTFCSISEGTTDGTRNGNSIRCKGVRFMAVIRNASVDPQPACMVRVIIVLDTQTISDNSVTTIGDLLENTGDSSVITSGLNSATAGRYKILYNRVFYLDNLTKPQHKVVKYIPLDHHIRFNGSLGSDIQKNNVFYFTFCNTPSGVYNNPSIEIDTRTYFYDN